MRSKWSAYQTEGEVSGLHIRLKEKWSSYQTEGEVSFGPWIFVVSTLGCPCVLRFTWCFIWVCRGMVNEVSGRANSSYCPYGGRILGLGYPVSSHCLTS